MKKGNLVEKQQICLDANSAASRSKFLHFKSVLTILALCLCVMLGGEVWAQAVTTIANDKPGESPLLLEVWGPQDASVSATPVERTSPNGKQLYCAYDIDITKDGREWQPEPEQPAMVTMEDPNFADGQLLDIYHEGANGLEFVATVASENGKITFPAHSFSVYIVAQAGDYARLKVILHRAGGSGEDVTIYVKPADISQGNFNQIVYNPGYGTLAAGLSCRGWTTNSDYAVADTASAMTFAQVRNLIRARLGSTVTDGQDMHFYTMLYKGYSIVYRDENDAVLHADFIHLRYDANPELPYTVDAAYTPRSNTEKFEGWTVSAGGGNISGHTDNEHVYTNETSITIKGDVVFDVKVVNGHWLIYHENGKGATYKAADFIENGALTANPGTMTRNGYTFAGWFYSDAEGHLNDPERRFTFGSTITEVTHIGAKWTPQRTAGYSVMVWKQSVSGGDNYDFDAIISLSGDVGSNINTVSSTGSGNGSYAIIGDDDYTGTNVTGHNYTGFHLDHYDQNVEIRPEGNSVLNVYYKRNEHTLNFQEESYEYQYHAIATGSDNDNDPYKYGYWGGSYHRIYWRNDAFRQANNNNGTIYSGTVYTGDYWRDIKTITALYGQYIGDNFPIVGSNGETYEDDVRWIPQGYDDTQHTYQLVITYIDAMPDDDVTFYYEDGSSRPTKKLVWYVEALGHTGSQTAPATVYDYYYEEKDSPTGKTYDEYKRLNASYNGVDHDDFIEIAGFDRLGADQYYGSRGEYTYYEFDDDEDYGDATVSFYYTRKVYDLNFMDGRYFDGNNGQLTEGVTSQGQLHLVRNIPYDKDITSYKTYRPDAAHTPDDFVFWGWYADEACTQPYVFNKMTEGGITVYAKWIQKQYRVFLHPGITQALAPYLSWGNENQSLCFRIDHGKTLDAPTGVCGEYDFVGWYTDDGLTHPFNEEAVHLNEGITTAYNKTTDFTDPMDRWGVVSGNTFNSDSLASFGTPRDTVRFWVIKRYDIYGKWRAKLPGAKGISVYFDDGYSPLPSTSNARQEFYQDKVMVVANDACTPPAGKEFSHWVLQRWNSSTNRFEDISGSRILPATPFKVLRTDARREISQWANPSDHTDVVNSSSETPPDGTHTEIFKATYTVKLRAEYVDVESRTNTSIVWYKNYSDENPDDVRTDNPIGINEVVSPTSIPTPPTRTGYIFKGWYKHNVTSGDAPTSINNSITECKPNFLFYNGTNYYKDYNASTGIYSNQVSKVAADLFNQTDYLYAIWQPDPHVSTPAEICPGKTASLQTTTNSYEGGYSWSNGTTGHQITTDQEVYTTTYTVTVSDVTGCSNTATVSVPVKALPTITGIGNGDMLWTGNAASTNWSTAGNWLAYNGSRYAVASELPSASSNVHIVSYSGCVNNNPTLTGAANANSVTIGSGRSLTLNSYALTLAGDLKNEGTFNNNTGILNIAGNLNNSGTFDYGEGKVVFNGTSQTITNASAFNFYDVQFDQPSVGTITAANGIVVNNNATFTKGVVDANATFNAGSSATVAGRYNSYVDGTVTKKGDNTASAFTFPTGNDGVLGAFTTKIESNSASGVSLKFNHMRDEGASGTGQAGFGLDVYPNWWNQNYMCPEADGLPKLDHVSNFEYWQVDMDNLGASTSLSSITLKVDASNQLEHFNQVYSGRETDKIYAAAHYDCWKNIGGTASLDNGNQTITVGEISTLSRTRAGNFDGIITLGSTDHNTVLPIELTSLTATCNGKSALVKWTTASERNNDYFSLERSDDAINFTEIARIAGAGNSIEPLDYSYIDYGVHGGDNYYRLVQVDYDGSRTVSEMVVATCVEAGEEPDVLAYPNPFNGELTVELENFSNRPARIDVYDVLGRLVYTEEVGAPQNSYQTVLHFGNLPDATYTVRVGTADFVINRKVVKQQ